MGFLTRSLMGGYRQNFASLPVTPLAAPTFPGTIMLDASVSGIVPIL